MVYVLALDGSPLMPTKRCGKVRHMLKDGRARCVKREPFTIQLNYETPHFTQDITLGVDCGFKAYRAVGNNRNEGTFRRRT